MRYPVPLEIVPQSDDETVLGGFPETVNVVFSGTGKELLRLGDQHYRVRKVLERGPPGPRRVTLAASDVTQSGNLEVKPVAVEPNVLTLTIDRVISKRVPLRALGELEPAEGYVLNSPIRFEPPSVTLIGARAILAGIDTVAVDLSQFRGSRREIRETIAVRIPEHPSVIVQPDSIHVAATLDEAEQEVRRSRRDAS